MYERKKLQKSKYKKRETIYVFKCKQCPEEIHLRSADLKRVTGFCRKCSDNISAKERGYLYRKKPYEALFNNFKKRTKRENKDNQLSYEEFLEFTKEKQCHYCYDDIHWVEYNLTANGSSYNLDRKDNNRGYIMGNCVTCCWKCNESKKNNFTYEQWYGMTEYFRKKKTIGISLNNENI